MFVTDEVGLLVETLEADIAAIWAFVGVSKQVVA